MPNAVNITLDEARELVSNRLLWPRVSEFLWDFAPQVHESWLEPKQLSLRDSPRVKRYILDSLGVEPCFHTFPKEDGSRILLLDGATLESTAKWLGALACAESLRRVTSGEVVRGLKSKFRGIYPEVFGYTAYFSGFDLSAKNAMDAKNPEEVVSVGLELLSSLLDACPEPLVTRFKLKLPKKLCERGVANGEKQELISAGGAVKKLLKLKFPEAYRLCC